MRRHRTIAIVLGVAVPAIVAASAVAIAGAAAQATQCSATFSVMHDDRIGTLRLPAGSYQLTTTATTCTKASALFSEFLDDYDGRLPKPWRYTADAVGEGTFLRGSGQTTFTALRTGPIATDNPGHISNGGGSHADLRCPGTFEVQHNDRIGKLRLRRGEYWITVLGARVTCARAEKLFARFLARPSGRLPGGWVYLPDQAEFAQGSTDYGFQIERAIG